MPLELARPGALWLLALLAPLIALYLLKVSRQRQRVGSVFLWRAAERALYAERPFRRLVPQIPLLLQIAAITLLALSAADPASRGQELIGDHVALVIDTSASMGARDASGKTRIELARAEARSVLSRLEPGSSAMLVEAGRQARIASAFDRDPRRLTAALDRISAQDVTGQLEPAVALALDRLRAAPGSKRLVIVTDSAASDPKTAPAAGVPIDVIKVGSPVDNAAIIRIDVRRGLDPVTRTDQVQAFAMVGNFGATPRRLFVTLRQRAVAEPLASRQLDLGPGERAPVVLTFEPEAADAGTGLIVELSPTDALPADDRAYARVPGSRKLPVALIPETANAWVRRALLADPDVELMQAPLEALGTEQLPADALVVVDGACPNGLPGSTVLVLNPPPGPCRTATVGATLEQPQITTWAEADPRFRFLSLDGVSVAAARRIETGGPREDLVETRLGPIIADVSLPGQQGTLVAFDVGDSNWPLKASFVLFVRNLLELAREQRARGIVGAAQTGDSVRVRVPLDVREVDIETPAGERSKSAAHGGIAVLPEAAGAGHYFVHFGGRHPGSVLVAANLTSESESNLAPKSWTATQATAAAGRAALPDALRRWGWLLALGALVLLALDTWWLTHRTGARAAQEPKPLLGRPVLLAAGCLALAPAIWFALLHLQLLGESMLRLERPMLALPCAALAVFAIAQLYGLPRRLGRSRRLLTELFAALAVCAAELAAVGVEAGFPMDRLSVIIAVDKSRSIDLVPAADARIESELALAEQSMRPGDRIARLAFGAGAALEDPLRPRTRTPSPQRAEVSRDSTDIGNAIRRALAEVPADSTARIVLLSDGVATRGDAVSAAAAALAAGVAVDAVPLEQAKLTDVRVVAVRAQPRASEGEAIELRVVTTATRASSVEVRVLRDGELIRKGLATIGEGDDVLRLREIAPGPGLHRYDVELSAQDASADLAPEDNAGSTFVRVGGPASTLIMAGDPARAAALERALRSAGFQTTTVAATGVPADAAGFATYDLIVLSEIPAADLAPSQLDALASYVKDLGGGLLLMGGDRSMGPGGYGKTPIEELSPVSFDLKQERRRASLAQIIAIDYSGSMAARAGSQTKLELANEAAARSADLLGAGDRLGVMHVDTTVSWTVPLAPVTDKAGIQKKIRGVGPGGGGILVDLTLEAAYAALQREQVNLKHLLLFADGDDAEERAQAPALVSRAKTRGITTSVVSLGRGGDTSALEHMSRLGGGRFYLIEDASRLPAVFAQETILASKSAINEVTFRPALGAQGPPVRGIDFAQAPELTGYVVTIPKGRALVHLRGPEDDPVLATWSVGLGRAAAFTSDFSDRWGSAWTSWDGAARLFAQLARDLARGADDPRVRLEADTMGAELEARATVVGDDGRAESFRRLRLRLTGPGGLVTEVPLEAVGAGNYAARVPLSRPGAYAMTAVDELSGESVATTGAVLTTGEELRPTGSDRATLTRIAEVSGGKLRDTLAGLFNDRPRYRFSYEPWTPILLQLAAVLLLLGVAARRLVLPPVFATLRARREARRAAARTAREAEAELAAQRLDSLRDAGQRAREQLPRPVAAPPAPLARPPAAPEPAAPPPAGPGSTVLHQPSAAEILLARRRGRRQ